MATSAGDQTATAEGDCHPECNACCKPISSKAQLQRIACNHIFHKACLNVSLKTRPFCPICNARIGADPPSLDAPQVMTRSQLKQSTVATASGNVSTAATAANVSGTAPGSDAISVDRIQEIVTDIVTVQQAQFFASLTSRMTQLIETNIAEGMSRLMASNSPRNPPQPPVTSPQQMQTLPAVEGRTFRELFGITPHSEQGNVAQNRPPSNHVNSISGYGSNSASDLQSRPDKVLQIMSNWKLKFNGGQNGLSVDNFIYRVEALTAQTLQGNFDILCGNASSLFDGKANDWFWRYHRSVSSICWNDMCRALREQYQDSRTDIDIRELIRERKQKPNESFDSFYDSIVALTDRLQTPLSDTDLVEILRRNLLPEIQHEILNLEIRSLQFLRDTCRRREFFMQDVRRRHGFALTRPAPMGKRISEIDMNVDVTQVCQEVQPSDEISALTLVCWNCNKAGHRYQDCVSDRTIFCYGCGAADTYKPNCPKCNSKNSRSNAPKSAPTPMPTKTRSIDLE